MSTDFIETPEGPLIAFQHLVSLFVEPTETQDQLRHSVLAQVVTGERHSLVTVQGPSGHDRARRLVADLLRRAGAEVFKAHLEVRA